jgi:hypothetical protein
MKKQIFLVKLIFIFIADLSSFCLAADNASPVNLLSNGDLRTSAGYGGFGITLIPSTGDVPARIDFSADKWSALLLKIPLPGSTPKDLMAGLTYRFLPSEQNLRSFNFQGNFLGADGKAIATDVKLRVPIASRTWDTVTLPVVPPAGATIFELRVAGSTSASMEIRGFSLTSASMTDDQTAAFRQAVSQKKTSNKPVAAAQGKDLTVVSAARPQPALYLNPPRQLAASVRVTDSTILFTALPKSLGGAEVFRTNLNTNYNQFFLIDLAEFREVNFVHLRKHFGPSQTPMDLDLAVYTGKGASAVEAGGSTDWQTVASLRDDDSRTDKIFSFPDRQVRFLKLTVLKTTTDGGTLADINEILVGRREITTNFSISAQTQSGANIISWDDVLGIAAWDGNMPAGDRISWFFNDAQGFYRIYRSCNLNDGYRCLNLEGEITTNSYIDDGLIPGETYYYKVLGFRNGMQAAESAPVSVTAGEGVCPTREEGLWNVSAGRFSLDDGIYYSDSIETHGNIGGFTYGVSGRKVFLMYPTLANRTNWPAEFKIDGARQSGSLAGCLVLGSVMPGDAGSGFPLYQMLYSGWDGMSYKMLYSNGSEMTVYMNGLSPALTLDATASSLRLFGDRDLVGTPAPAYVAFSRNGTVQLQSLSSPVSLEGMDKSWLIFWWGDGAVSSSEGIDLPVLVTLSERPQQIAIAAGALELSFTASAGKVSIMPLYGVTKVSTAGWSGGLSSSVVQRADRWVARLKTIPVRCRDRFSIEEANNRVRVELTYEYLDAPDAWKTPALQLAPVAPSTAFVRSQGLPIVYDSSVVDQDFACYCGPYEAAERTNSVAYWLPAPMNAILDGYKPEIPASRTNLLPEIMKTLNAEAQIGYAVTNGPKEVSWRPRNIDLNIQQYLTVYPILSNEGREGVGQICDAYLTTNRYFDLRTYEFRRDRYSGKKYIISKDPDCRFSLPMDYGFGTGGALWTIYKYAETLEKWDYIKSHWDSVIQYGTVFEAGTDWNSQAPSAMTFYSEWSGNPDYLMSYLQGHLALARMAHRLGDEKTYRRSVYQFCRTFLTYYEFWTIQNWVVDHQPHYNFLAAEGDAPERGCGYASDIRGEGSIFHFVNSRTDNDPRVYYPFVRTNPDIAVFWDKYMRDIIGKYLYHDLARICPNAIECHAILARAYLFEDDPQTVRKWIDHAFMNNGDWGNANHYAALLATVEQPPVSSQPPDPQWVDAGYEKRITGDDQPTVLLDFNKIHVEPVRLKLFQPVWTIGHNDNSGREFSQEDLTQQSLNKHVLSRNPKMTANDLRIFMKKTPRYFEDIVSQWDGKLYTVGQSTMNDWSYLQHSAWKVMGGGMAYDGNHHPRTISFQMADPPDTNSTYSFVIDIHRLATYYPLFMTVNINGHRQSVRCPLPFYACYAIVTSLPLVADDGETILKFPVPGEWLKKGENRITIHVEGTSGVYYDWLGFGHFE